MSSVDLSSVNLGSNLTYLTTQAGGLLDVVQDVGQSAAPTFAGLSIRGASGILGAVSGTVTQCALSPDLHFAGGSLSLAQPINASASPTFEGLCLKASPSAVLVTDTNGKVASAALSGLTYAAGTLATSQDISAGANVTFNNITAAALQLAGSPGLLTKDTTGQVSHVTLGASLKLSTLNVLNTAQQLDTLSIPCFAGLSLGALNGLLVAQSGAVSAVVLGDGLSLQAGPLGLTLDTAQNLNTNGRPKFASVTAESLTLSNSTSGILVAQQQGVVSAVTLGNGLTMQQGENGPVLNTAQALDQSANPTFASLAVGSLSGMVAAQNGQLSAARLSANLKYSGNTLDTVQDLHSGSSPVFNSLNTNGLRVGNSTGLLYRSNGLVGNVNISSNLSLVSGLLDTCQALQSGCVPVFLNLKLTQLTNCLVSSGQSGNLSACNIGASLTFADNTLNTVQDIRTAANVRFAGLAIGQLGGAGGALATVINGNVDIARLSPSLVYNGGVLSTVQDLTVTGSPKFSGLNLSSMNGLLCATAGTVGQLACGSGLTLNKDMLNTVQDIGQKAIVTFASLTLNTLRLTGYAGLLGAYNSFVLPAALGPNLTLTQQTATSAGLLDTCQPIARTSTPQFAGLMVGKMSGLVCAQSGLLSNVTCSSNLIYSAGTLDTVQALGLKSSPTFASITVNSLTIEGLNGVLCADVGRVMPLGIGSNLSLSFNTLNTVQNIGPTASVTFASLTLDSLAAGGLVTSQGGVLQVIKCGPGLAYNATARTLDVAQAMGPNAKVTFAGITTDTLNITGVSGILASYGTTVSSITIGDSITLTHGKEDILDAVQDIRPTATPCFAGLTLGNLSAMLCAVNGVVSPVYFNSNLIFNPTTKILNTCQDLTQHSSPVFMALTLASLRLSSYTGMLSAINGSVGLLNVSANLSLVGNVLDTCQPIGISAAPQFAGLTISSLTGILCANAGVFGTLRTGTSLSYMNNILNTSQPLDVSATPLFAGLSVNTLSVGNATGILSSTVGLVSVVQCGPSVSFKNNTLDTLQPLNTNSSPVFNGLTIGTDTGLLSRVNGLVSRAVCGPNVTFTHNTLDTVQPINTSAAPVFAGLTIGALTFGRNTGFLYGNNGMVGNLVLGANMEIQQNTVGTVPVPSFADVTLGTASLGPTGYTPMPNGLMAQWTQVTAAQVAAGPYTWVFPKAFMNACLSVQVAQTTAAAVIVSQVSTLQVTVSAPSYVNVMGF